MNQASRTGRPRSFATLRYLLAAAIVLLGSMLSPAHAQLVPGDAVVIDFSAGLGFAGALFRVDAITGARTLLSDFGNPAQGPLGLDPAGVALEASGQILVIDFSAGPGFAGALFRVDATTGARTLLSDFGNPAQGPLGVDPFGVAVVPAPNNPTDKSQCTNGGWAAFGFKNQGQCVRFVETGRDSPTGE